MLRAVIDTNVLFTGLTRLGPCAEVVDLWVNRKIVACVSTALALEYQDVLGRKLGPDKQHLVTGALQALLDRADFVPIRSRVRPMSPDPDDDFVIECAMNGQAVLVTQNLRDLRVAQDALGIPVLTPSQFLIYLKEKSWLE